MRSSRPNLGPPKNTLGIRPALLLPWPRCDVNPKEKAPKVFPCSKVDVPNSITYWTYELYGVISVSEKIGAYLVIGFVVVSDKK
jgi:hypothetical protein